jgi:hypothetical protein
MVRELPLPALHVTDHTLDTIFKLPLNQPAITLKKLRQRYDGLCARSAGLPYMHNIHTPDGFDLDKVLSWLPQDFFAVSVSDTDDLAKIISKSEINRVAFVLALFGWGGQAETEPKADMAACDACFRRLGLWLFKSKEIDENGKETVGAMMSHLDPICEHRDYCPWRNPRSQSGPPSAKNGEPANPELAAWEVVQRVIKNDFFLRERNKPQSEKPKPAAPTPLEDAGDTHSFFDNSNIDDEDAKSIREQKDKERWSRLRKVKSLFDTKSMKKKSHSSLIDKSKGRS